MAPITITNINDQMIEEGRLLIDVSGVRSYDTTPFICQKIAEINEERKLRDLPSIDFEIEEIQGDSAYLKVWTLCAACGGKVDMDQAEQVEKQLCAECLDAHARSVNAARQFVCHGTSGVMRMAEEVRALFREGSVAHGRDYFEDDWFRFFPDGTYQNHELCCHPECPFHEAGEQKTSAALSGPTIQREQYASS